MKLSSDANRFILVILASVALPKTTAFSLSKHASSSVLGTPVGKIPSATQLFLAQATRSWHEGAGRTSAVSPDSRNRNTSNRNSGGGGMPFNDWGGNSPNRDPYSEGRTGNLNDQQFVEKRSMWQEQQQGIHQARNLGNGQQPWQGKAQGYDYHHTPSPPQSQQQFQPNQRSGDWNGGGIGMGQAQGSASTNWQNRGGQNQGPRQGMNGPGPWKTQPDEFGMGMPPPPPGMWQDPRQQPPFPQQQPPRGINGMNRNNNNINNSNNYGSRQQQFQEPNQQFQQQRGNGAGNWQGPGAAGNWQQSQAQGRWLDPRGQNGNNQNGPGGQRFNNMVDPAHLNGMPSQPRQPQGAWQQNPDPRNNAGWSEPPPQQVRDDRHERNRPSSVWREQQGNQNNRQQPMMGQRQHNGGNPANWNNNSGRGGGNQGPSSPVNNNNNNINMQRQEQEAHARWKTEDAMRREEEMMTGGKALRTPFVDSTSSHGGYPLDGRATAKFRPDHHPRPPSYDFGIPQAQQYGGVGVRSNNNMNPRQQGQPYQQQGQRYQQQQGQPHQQQRRSVNMMGNTFNRQRSPTVTATATTERPLNTQQTSAPTGDLSQWATLEQEILMEHNKLRKDPLSYIPILEEYMSRMDSQGHIPDGCGPDCTLLTQEGQSAVQEAIQFLKTQKPVPPLEFNEALAHSSKLHASDQVGGSIGHAGSNGSQPGERIKQVLPENLSYGENIAYGHTTSAQDIVRNLLVDDGVRDRGHRKVLFSPNLNVAGVGCGPHERYQVVSVVNYAKIHQPMAGKDTSLAVTNESADEILALFCGDTEVLGGRSLYPGEAVKLELPPHVSCRTSMEVHLGGNFEPIIWNDVYVCNSELTLDRTGQLRIQY